MMAPPAANGDAFAALDEIKPPPGVVLPPKEIKGMLHYIANKLRR
jgi:splicing factor 3A subunit 1